MFAAVIFQLDSQSRRVLQENPYEGADNPQELVPHQPFSVGKSGINKHLRLHPDLALSLHTRAEKLLIVCVVTAINICCGYMFCR